MTGARRHSPGPAHPGAAAASVAAFLAASGTAAHAAAGGGIPGLTAVVAALAVATPAAAVMVRWWASARVVVTGSLGSGLLIHLLLHAVTRHDSATGHASSSALASATAHAHAALPGAHAVGVGDLGSAPTALLPSGHVSAAASGGQVMLGAHLLASLSVIVVVRLLQTLLIEADTVWTLLRWRPRHPGTLPTTSTPHPGMPFPRTAPALLRHCVVVGAP